MKISRRAILKFLSVFFAGACGPSIYIILDIFRGRAQKEAIKTMFRTDLEEVLLNIDIILMKDPRYKTPESVWASVNILSDKIKKFEEKRGDLYFLEKPVAEEIKSFYSKLAIDINTMLLEIPNGARRQYYPRAGRLEFSEGECEDILEKLKQG